MRRCRTARTHAHIKSRTPLHRLRQAWRRRCWACCGGACGISAKTLFNNSASLAGAARGASRLARIFRISADAQTKADETGLSGAAARAWQQHRAARSSMAHLCGDVNGANDVSVSKQRQRALHVFYAHLSPRLRYRYRLWTLLLGRFFRFGHGPGLLNLWHKTSV